MIETHDGGLPADEDISIARVEGDIALCRSPVSLTLIAYWRDLAARRDGRPRWRDVRLMDLYKIAHHLVVKDLIDGGRDYVNRFWGSSVTEGLGFDGTRKRVSEYDPSRMRRSVQRRYHRLVSMAEPEMVRGYITTLPEHDHLPFELVHLPLWNDDGDAVRHIISAYHFGFVASEDGV